jgi:hypothetical protein
MSMEKLTEKTTFRLDLLRNAVKFITQCILISDWEQFDVLLNTAVANSCLLDVGHLPAQYHKMPWCFSKFSCLATVQLQVTSVTLWLPFLPLLPNAYPKTANKQYFHTIFTKYSMHVERRFLWYRNILLPFIFFLRLQFPFVTDMSYVALTLICLG